MNIPILGPMAVYRLTMPDSPERPLYYRSAEGAARAALENVGAREVLHGLMAEAIAVEYLTSGGNRYLILANQTPYEKAAWILERVQVL